MERKCCPRYELLQKICGEKFTKLLEGRHSCCQVGEVFVGEEDDEGDKYDEDGDIEHGEEQFEDAEVRD